MAILHDEIGVVLSKDTLIELLGHALNEHEFELLECGWTRRRPYVLVSVMSTSGNPIERNSQREWH